MAKALLSDKKLNQIRRLNQRAMPDLITILTPNAEVPDGRGGFTRTFTAGATLSGRFRPATQKADQVEGGQPINTELYQVTLPWDTVLTNKYRIRRESIDYEVVGDISTRSYMVGLRFLVRKV